MPKKYLKKTSIKRLFLICPTDSMEQPILNHFIGEAYFYTALGVYFEFDFMVQSKLWELICEHGIEEVVFISAIDNIFYQHAFGKNVKRNYPVDDALAIAKKKISRHLMQSEVFSSNIHLLAVRHLKNQIKRLLATHYLGIHLATENIPVNAYVYQREYKAFYDHCEIEKKGYLLNSFSYN